MEDEKKSEVYSNNMTQAMGAGKLTAILIFKCSIEKFELFAVLIIPLVICVSVLTYRHELGMNYDFILPNLIVGSCLQVTVRYIFKQNLFIYFCFTSYILLFTVTC